MARFDIAVVIPAYNEEQGIGNAIGRARKYGTVIVVSDGSTDGTAWMASQFDDVIVVEKAENGGYDRALEAGFKEALRHGFRYAVTMDADGQHDADTIRYFIEALADHDLVLGRRPKKARWSEHVIGLYFRLRFGVHDILCGMKGYNMALYQANGRFDGMGSIGSELALFALKKGVRVKEAPVPIYPRTGRSRFGGALRGNLRILRALLKDIQFDLGWRGER